MTANSPHYRRRLPHWVWWTTGAFAVAAAAETWPAATAVVLALLTLAVILVFVRATRPGRLRSLLQRITTRRHRPATARGPRTLAAFQHLRPDEFEKAIAALAREDKARVAHAQHVGQAGDRGADVLVTLRDGRRILIQCKKYRPGNNVGSETIQTINGTYRDIHHCHAAIIVTTARFTEAAHTTSRMLRQPITLIDGHALEQWANGGHAPW
jgi:restriction system protein